MQSPQNSNDVLDTQERHSDRMAQNYLKKE
jgi:hypothetical protein